MIKKISWDEFRDSGMLWWVNRILHTFGLVIVVDVDERNTVTGAYPARTKFRGFDENSEGEGFKKVSKYMVDNSKVLKNEADE